MKRLVIVQDVPTQFDMPLYNEIARSGTFVLTVIYTQVAGITGVDPEIGRAPQWDHVIEEVYERIDLTPAQARVPAALIQRIAALEPNLVIVSGYYPPLHRKLVIPLKKLGFKVGLRSDNTLQHSNFRGMKGLVKKLVLPVWLRRYTSWHPVGSLARTYLESVSHTTRPTYLFPYNVDNAWFAAQSAPYRNERASPLQDIGFPADSFVVLGIMKWHEREDPLVLIRAFRQLLEKQPDARLIMVGDGPLRDTVEQMVADIAGKVSTPGYLPYSSLPRLYALADIFVHPAPGEPWGVSVNEAMACGVPVVVSTGVGAGEDLVEPGRTGFEFQAGDWRELADVLIAFSRDADRAAMRIACLERMQDWSYASTRTVFEQALEASD